MNFKKSIDTFEQTISRMHAYECVKISSHQKIEYVSGLYQKDYIVTDENNVGYIVQRDSTNFEIFFIKKLSGNQIWALKRTGDITDNYFSNIEDLLNWMDNSYAEDIVNGKR